MEINISGRILDSQNKQVIINALNRWSFIVQTNVKTNDPEYQTVQGLEGSMPVREKYGYVPKDLKSPG